MRRFSALFFLCALPLFCQTNTGELRLKVADPSGLAVKVTVQIVSEANQYTNIFVTDDAGNVVAKRLSYGAYLVEIHQPGFADVSQTIEIRSALPTEV